MYLLRIVLSVFFIVDLVVFVIYFLGTDDIGYKVFLLQHGKYAKSVTESLILSDVPPAIGENSIIRQVMLGPVVLESFELNKDKTYLHVLYKVEDSLHSARVDAGTMIGLEDQIFPAQDLFPNVFSPGDTMLLLVMYVADRSESSNERLREQLSSTIESPEMRAKMIQSFGSFGDVVMPKSTIEARLKQRNALFEKGELHVGAVVRFPQAIVSAK